jgi:hypothetical protein
VSGYNLVRKIKSLEEQLHALGFRWGFDKHSHYQEFGDVVAVFPRDDELPIYSRDAQLFSGSISELERWLQGLKWAREYDIMLRLSDEKKRERKEQDERNRQLVRMLKQEELDTIG